MQTTQQLAALKAMGIEVWRARFEDKASLDSYHSLSLGSTIIIADHDFSKTIEEQNLLQAIAKALGSEVKANVETWKDLENNLDNYSIIIAMGKNIIVDLRKKAYSGKIISTHSPAQLLIEPKLKSETWQAIRQFKI